MSLLTVVQGVCAAVGVEIPISSVFTNINANRTMQEMVALANEMAQRIAYDTREWTALRNTHIIVGDGATASFSFPADFKRLLLTGNLYNAVSPNMPLRYIADPDVWLQRRLSQTYDAQGEWSQANNAITILPVLAVGATVYFNYLDKNCIWLQGGGAGDRFMNDGDQFKLDERLLKLGMIYQWKAHKGSPYAEDMGSFSDALAMEMGHDKPSPIIIGRVPMSSANVAYPWPVP